MAELTTILDRIYKLWNTMLLNVVVQFPQGDGMYYKDKKKLCEFFFWNNKIYQHLCHKSKQRILDIGKHNLNTMWLKCIKKAICETQYAKQTINACETSWPHSLIDLKGVQQEIQLLNDLGQSALPCFNEIWDVWSNIHWADMISSLLNLSNLCFQ